LTLSVDQVKSSKFTVTGGKWCWCGWCDLEWRLSSCYRCSE